ncbi:NAD(P)-binding domain-containing protein [Serinicoccus kebangsaanensis]|uniref:NAD(P)-binding domain-containing protein n=1 Tax=Serinicoccus kebangsaanensis TaxID=2602069 RepID=UPI00124CD056|nr:NAD(P)-binding domain-containing protein [Serinicoccus kebangsaanensis]
MTSTIGILGVGAIASAIVTGLCEGVDDPPPVVLSPRGAEAGERLARAYPGVEVGPDNQAVLDRADVVLVCLRRQDAGLLADLSWRPDQTVVSAVTGLSAPDLAAAVAPAHRTARAVPMVATAVRAWSTPLRPDLPEARTVFERTGGVLAVGSDEEFDAVATGLGTVAPFFDYLGTVATFLTDHGMARPDAERLLGQSFAQVAAPLGQGDVDLGELLRGHATPGGGNEQLAILMREAGVPKATRAALDEVFRRQTGGSYG